MSHQPEVTVAMSVYNARRFVGQAITSILTQTYPHFELIIVDDGSTDGSQKILKRYAAQDERIRLVCRENRGIARTRNEITQQARGELIAVMDADDIALPDRLARQVEFLKHHPEVVCVGGAQDWIDEAGRLLVHYDVAAQNDEIQQLALSGITPINHPCAMIRRLALMQVGGYSEMMATVGDLDLFLRLGEVGELANLKETVLQYRLHPKSVSEKLQLQQTEDKRAACQRAWQRRGIEGTFQASDPWRPFDRTSRQAFLLRFGWQFFNQRQRSAAIAYGWKAIQTLPLDQEGWRLLVCSLIKPLPGGGRLMEQIPVVSVVMAVYNSERYLAQAVESILQQTFTDFELVIIDDGSTDRSLKILQRYAAKDDRIRLISRGNRGIPQTRNELLANARGEFVAIMDSDDVAIADRLARQVDYLRAHPEVVCVGGAQDWIDEAGRLLLWHQEPETDSEIQQRMLMGQTCINNPSAMMRRAALMQVGGYDESMSQAEDLDLFLKLGELGKLANLPETVLQYRQHRHSISERQQIADIELRRKACEQAWQRRGIQGQFTIDKPWRPMDRSSRYAYLLDFGWRFFVNRDRSAAIHYGWQAVLELPWQLDGWKLLVCSLVKPLPKLESP